MKHEIWVKVGWGPSRPRLKYAILGLFNSFSVISRKKRIKKQINVYNLLALLSIQLLHSVVLFGKSRAV